MLRWKCERARKGRTRNKNKRAQRIALVKEKQLLHKHLLCYRELGERRPMNTWYEAVRRDMLNYGVMEITLIKIRMMMINTKV